MYIGLGLLAYLNSAACFVTASSRKYEHITPILTCLQWIPVRYKYIFQNSVTDLQGSKIMV